MDSINGVAFFCSWSGGKDSCLALYHAIRNGGKPKYLLTLLQENGVTSRSHGLPLWLLKRQARALGIPLIVRPTTWDDYESTLLSAIHEIKKNGVHAGVFGHIVVERNREMVERICAAANIRPYLPLWQKTRHELLKDFMDSNFKSRIVVIREGKLDGRYLGRTLDEKVVAEFEQLGVDLSGERDEYHTLVTDGPIFSSEIPLVIRAVGRRDGYMFLNLARQ